MLRIILYTLFITSSLQQGIDEKTLQVRDKARTALKTQTATCAQQVNATQQEIIKFINNIPQTTTPGKCLIACIYRLNGFLSNQRLSRQRVLRSLTNKDLSQAELNALVDNCLLAESGDECEMAAAFSACVTAGVREQLNAELFRAVTSRRALRTAEGHAEWAAWVE